MASKSISTQAIVIKRINTGELDRIITLLTPDQGKVRCVAKGVRKMTSSQRAFLEPGNHVSVLLIQTQNLPILTQTTLKADFPLIKRDLRNMKRLLQVLEMIDQLFPEGVEEPELFAAILDVLKGLDKEHVQFTSVQEQLNAVLINLGYQDFHDTDHPTLLSYVSEVADRPLHSYEYLTIKE